MVALPPTAERADTVSNTSWGLALTLARREIRGSIGRFRVFLIALMLGVTAIGAVGSIAASMRGGIALNSRLLFGGDIEASSTHKPVPAEMRQAMQGLGKMSSLVTMRAMLGTGDDTRPMRRLVNLKAVDNAWPMLGETQLEPAISIDAALGLHDGKPGVVVNPGLLRVLGLDVGDTARLGDTDVIIAAKLMGEPDQRFGFGALAPRVIIALGHLSMTGLDRPGALLTYRERLLLNDPGRADIFLASLRDLSGNSLTRLRHHLQGSAGFDSFLDRTETFLTLVSLTALLIGGLGVSSAVRAWLGQRMPVLATLKCLGAPAALIFRIYFLQVLFLALLGTFVGLGLAAMGPPIAEKLLGGVFAVPMAGGLHMKPLLVAGGFGILTAVAFSLWPLGKAQEVKPAALFRTLITPPEGRPQWRFLFAISAVSVMLIMLTMMATTSLKLAIGFAGGLAASLVILALVSEVVMRLAKRLPMPKNTALRLAMAGLVRPGNNTRGVIITFGLGLAVLVAITLAENNMNGQINARLDRDAPAWFFIDIQPGQKDQFSQMTTTATGDDNVVMVPMVRGRVVALAGVPSNEIDAPSSEAWILNGDRALTWSATAPEGNRIVKGEWWDEDYSGPPLVSMDDEAMVAFGLNLGDSVTLNIAGREMEATIASSRQIEWENFGLNFVFILSPGMIDKAPHNWVAAVYTDDPETEAAIDRDVARAMPNVSSVSVREAAATAGRILGLVSTAIRITAAITLVAGFAVLAGTVAASESRRIHSATILKVLGAERRVILSSYIAEYALLGGITALVSMVIGGVACWALMTGFLNSNFTFPPGLALQVTVGGMVATVSLGMIGAIRSLSRKPGPVLRHE